MQVNHLKNYGPEKPLRGKYDYPIYIIEGFDLPELNYVVGDLAEGHTHRYELNIHNNPAELQQNFIDTWREHVKDLYSYINSQDTLVLDQMWKGRLKTLQPPPNLDLFCDKPGLSMGPHIDNRSVVGVLIINLKDNNCGTVITELEYEGPRKKGTGIFILNNYNTTHSIDVPLSSPEDRYIGYQTTSYEDFKVEENE